MYEQRIAALFEKQLEMYEEKSKRLFQAACSRQASRNKDGTFLLESILEGRSLALSIVADCHVPSVQALHHATVTKKLKNYKATDTTFAGSNVLLALKDLHETLEFFVKDGEVRAFAGGGVVPPRAPEDLDESSEKGSALDGMTGKTPSMVSAHLESAKNLLYFPGHPAYGLMRSTAFPLCQVRPI